MAKTPRGRKAKSKELEEEKEDKMAEEELDDKADEEAKDNKRKDEKMSKRWVKEEVPADSKASEEGR